MITQEVWMDIKALNRQGMSIRAIARHTGLSRQTVRKTLSQKVPAPYRPRTARPSKLDAFKPYLLSALAARPWVRATLLYREVVEQGFSGHYELVKCFVREQRRAEAARRRACVRFETGPGVEGQFDWKGPVTGVLEDAPEQKVWIFRFLLAWSRYRVTSAVTSTKLAAVLADLQDVFLEFGGVPQRLVFDNFKAAVLEPRPRLKLQPEFVDFCAHYGVEPEPALVYTPERKGKTERTFRDLEESGLLRRSYSNLEALRRALCEDDARYLERVHTTTGEVPIVRLVREKTFLMGLPGTHFDVRVPETRRVLSECVVSYGGAYYSVPYELVGQRVTVKADPRRPRLEIFDAAQLVASHTLVAKGERSMVEAHIAELRRPRWDRVRQRRPTPAPAPEPQPSQLVTWTRVAVAVRPIEEYADIVEVL